MIKKILLSIVILAIPGYFLGPGLFISFTGKAFVYYIEKFDNSPELKRKLKDAVILISARAAEQGYENYLQSIDEPDREFLAASMNKIKDNGRGLSEQPLSDDELSNMIKTSFIMLGLETREEVTAIEEIVCEEPQTPEIDTTEKTKIPEKVKALSVEEDRHQRMQKSSSFFDDIKEVD